MEKVSNYFNEISDTFITSYNELRIALLLSGNYKSEEIALIYKAFKKADELHRGNYRKSGEEYIVHPLSVAKLLVDYGFDYSTICAALLHDTVEDTDYTIEELKEDFGEEIALLVDGVTKMEKTNFSSKEESEMETHRKILHSITVDARIIVVKLADRLHNMMTLEALKEKSRLEISNETKDFYVPIARNLGIYKLKDEIQDLSLFFLDNDAFLEYYDLRKKIKNDNQEIVQMLGDRTKRKLLERNVNMDYNFKVKNVAGIYEELRRKKKLDCINDLVAIRMLVNTNADCYQTLGVVHEIGKHNFGLLSDFISTPKYNGYRSLNTNVRFCGENIQARIRTFDMQRVNSLGVVTNWTEENQRKINEMCMDLIKIDESDLETKDYLRESADKFLIRKIAVNSPFGIIQLKEGSTLKDYLDYTNSSLVENEAITVNDLNSNLNYVLQDGDYINIIKNVSKIKRKGSLYEKRN